MKIIKTYFDKKGYEEELSRVYNEIINQFSYPRVANPFDLNYIHPRTESEILEMAKERVNREPYEKTVEYLYLNAVAESDGKPLLIVYNEEEGVKTIYADNCKLIED